MNLVKILEATGGRLLQPLASEAGVGKISTDTRVVGPGDVFFALKGPHFDGHDFIPEAFEKGARHFVFSNPKKILIEKEGCSWILVEDVLKAYGDLARYHRQESDVPTIAITGSSGKTTVKEMTAHLLASKFSVHKNKGTENNLVGVPKTILQLESTHQAMVLELGTNQPGEIERLSEIAAPEMGVLTLIGHSHLEGLQNIEGVRAEKLGLLKHLKRGGTLFINGEDPRLREVQSGVHRLIRVGFEKEGNDFYADNLWCHENGTSFQLNGKEVFEIPLLGRHNVINALLAIAVASTWGVPVDFLRKSLKEFKPVSGRLHLKSLAQVQFIDDSYNSNPASFQAALETLKSLKSPGKKGVVFGDMLELGQEAQKLHQQMGAVLAGMNLDFVVAVGPLAALAAQEAVEKGMSISKTECVGDSVEAGRLCRKLASAGDLVLIKGSRGMKMEKVMENFV